MKEPGAMPNLAFEVSADRAQLANGEAGILLKLSSPQVELNVWFLQDEATQLISLRERAPELESLRLGQSLDQGVFWSRDAQGHCYLVVGEDNETWDLGLTLDAKIFEAVLFAIAHPNR